MIYKTDSLPRRIRLDFIFACLLWRMFGVFFFFSFPIWQRLFTLGCIWITLHIFTHFTRMLVQQGTLNILRKRLVFFSVFGLIDGVYYRWFTKKVEHTGKTIKSYVNMKPFSFSSTSLLSMPIERTFRQAIKELKAVVYFFFFVSIQLICYDMIKFV